MAQAAAAAVSAGIGWGVVNREVDYVLRLRRGAKAPIFCVATDHAEVGRIQAAQMAALVKDGGGVLFMECKSGSGVARARSGGMYSLVNRSYRREGS